MRQIWRNSVGGSECIVLAGLLALVFVNSAVGQESAPAGPGVAHAEGKQGARAQVEAEARRQAAGSAAPRRPRRAVDQTIGTSGRRLQRTPYVIGDFPGLGNATQFFADPGDFGNRLVTIQGDPLNNLPVDPNVQSVLQVTIPGDRTTLGQNLGKPLTLTFVQPDPLSDPVITGLDKLSFADRQRLRDFLSRQSSDLFGSTGTISEADLALLRAQASGQSTANAPFVDVYLPDATFFKGGIAPEQLISLPRGGSMVSQHKVAEGNSPMPRDRVFFHYNQFQSVPGLVGRSNVSRFVPGLERTFNDAASSVEVRMPFAGTFDSTQTLSESVALSGGSAAELGSLAVVFKQLFYSGDSIGFSAGASLELPTADDTEITTSAFSITRSAESVMLAPYVGFVAAPDDRLFFQGFCQVQFDTNGETVEFRDRFLQQSVSGRLQEATMLYTDLQSGYWVYRNDQPAGDAGLTGVATLLELHLNQTLGGTDAVSSNLGQVPLTFGTLGGSYGMANLTSGITAEFNRQTNLTMSVVLPLTSRDRVFDSEFHVGLNHAFGRGSMFRQPVQQRR